MSRALRSSAPTISAIVGNDMLDRAAHLVRRKCVPWRWAEDARQEAVLAELEGRDRQRALRKFVRAERAQGRTGGRHGDRGTTLYCDLSDESDPVTWAVNGKRVHGDAEDTLLQPGRERVERLARETATDVHLAGLELAEAERHLAEAERDQRIFDLRAQGRSIRAIAAELGLTKGVVSAKCKSRGVMNTAPIVKPEESA